MQPLRDLEKSSRGPVGKMPTLYAARMAAATDNPAMHRFSRDRALVQTQRLPAQVPTNMFLNCNGWAGVHLPFRLAP